MSQPKNVSFVLLLFMTAFLKTVPQVVAKSKTQSLRSILSHFTEKRNAYVDPDAKERARAYIVNMFKDHGLHTWTEEFPSNQEKHPGVNIIGRLPGRYTGTRDDKMVLIGSHYDTVKTSPGVDDNGSGMTALLQVLKLFTSPDCGSQQLTATEGEIMTPYYNTEYPNKLACEWIISMNAEQKDLRLKFTTFDLEESVNCTADYVVMWDGKDKTAPLIGKYCGKNLPEPVNASAQSLYIMFHSDELDAFKGFKAEWTSTVPPPIKSAVNDYHPVMWQLIGFLVLTSSAFGL